LARRSRAIFPVHREAARKRGSRTHESFMSHANSPANRYGSIAAEIYDLDKPFGALPDTRFYLDRFADLKGPILEPACGSGRAMIPLLEAGHDVTGFDPSAEMLARCRARCAGAGFTPDLSRQRFEDFSYDRAFAAIFVPVGSFTLIDDFDTAMAVLARFHAHLAPGGRLLIDIQPLTFLARGSEDRRRWTAPNGDLLTLEAPRIQADWIRQRADYTIRYERWRDNALIESQLEPMAQRYWGMEEFKLALRASGFSAIAMTANYTPGRPLASDARVITYEARKD
jgi:SAM-dependent methyltransferase